MEQRGTINFKPFSNTYFSALPKDLQVLLTYYYHGPLEIKYHPGDKHCITRVLKYDSQNRLDAEIKIKHDVTSILSEYNQYPDKYNIKFPDGFYINWTRNFVGLAYFGECGFALYDYMALVFWEKLRHVMRDLIDCNKSGLSVDDIRLSFNSKVY